MADAPWPCGFRCCQAARVGGVAVDGKVLRGVRSANGRQVHVFAAILHGQGVVLAQRQIPDKTNEIPEFQPLITSLDLKGKVVTADAMHAQVAHAQFVVEKKEGEYVFTVKDNQPALLQAIQDLDDGSFSPSGDAEEQGPRAYRNADDPSELRSRGVY